METQVHIYVNSDQWFDNPSLFSSFATSKRMMKMQVLELFLVAATPLKAAEPRLSSPRNGKEE